jgi:prepilin-type N-terminal cleavage/methylation domain-containing protein
MKNRIQQGFTLIELLVVITIIAILASLAVPTFSKIQEKGNITKGISNCRQIITTLRIYSSDNGGNYPDTVLATAGGGGGGGTVTSNAAFREMFKGGEADNEMIFGCPASQYGNPDGNIGANPDYTNALEAGKKENHWMMTGGLNDSASGSYPLVYEVATNATWNPTWDCDAAGKGTKGRTWSGGKVIIGMNDSSVALQPCSSTKGTNSLKDQGSGGTGASKNLFTQNSGGTGGDPTILDVE